MWQGADQLLERLEGYWGRNVVRVLSVFLVVLLLVGLVAFVGQLLTGQPLINWMSQQIDDPLLFVTQVVSLMAVFMLVVGIGSFVILSTYLVDMRRERMNILSSSVDEMRLALKYGEAASEIFDIAGRVVESTVEYAETADPESEFPRQAAQLVRKIDQYKQEWANRAVELRATMQEYKVLRNKHLGYDPDVD